MNSTPAIPFAQARFTLLADATARLEWAEDGVFEDRSTLAVLNRPPALEPVVRMLDGGWIEMEGPLIRIRHREDGKCFHRDNLVVSFSHQGEWSEWRPGDPPTGNLGGTARTLDMADGDRILAFKPVEGGGMQIDRETEMPVDCGLGLLSRDGWALIDDSAGVVLEERGGGLSPWAVPRPPGQRCDWYFFGYGLNHKKALADAALVFGKQPLMPRWALGYWYSRYWAYTDRELEALAEDFSRMGLPLDVVVIDMDWHLPGWTGYTWCPDFFPNPTELLQSLHARGLRVALNLHPADGVGRHESAFPAMCRDLGLDPESTERIPFDCTDPRFMAAYFKHLHHPEEERGVDLWWMDWQQGTETAIPGLDPLAWLNHLHWQDQVERRPDRRPLIFSRYSGIGSGRQPIGFSGDTFSNWASLAFQPRFTAQAANVLFGTWSHDLGGHLAGTHAFGTGSVQADEFDPEIFVRWVQFGIYSPIFRTHASKSADSDRRFWIFPDPFREALFQAALERQALIPYIYTELRKTEDHAVSLCHPLYVEWPEEEEAYCHPRQYLFGSQMMIHPVVGPVDSETGLADVETWVPPGHWFDAAQGCLVKGPAPRKASYLLDETPLYIRAGAVVPRQSARARAGGDSGLVLDAYPGGSGAYEIFEDDGESLAYRKGEATWTPIIHEEGPGFRRLTFGPARGTFSGGGRPRRLTVRFHGVPPASNVSLNGHPVKWHFDGRNGVVETIPCEVSPMEEHVFEASFAHDLQGVFAHGWKGFMARMAVMQRIVNSVSPARPIHPEERLATRIAQTGNRLTRNPQSFTTEMAALEHDIEHLPRVLQEYVESCTRVKNQNAAATVQRAARLLSTVEPPSNRLRPRKNGAFTLVEILAVIAILAILAAVLLPVFGRMQQNAGASRCASNLRQISTYINQFMSDNNGCLPISRVWGSGGIAWYEQLTPYSGVENTTAIQPAVKTFVCPQSNFPNRLDGRAMGLSYGYNAKFGQAQWRPVNMRRPLSRIILLAERWASNTPDPNGRRGGADWNWAVNPPYDAAPNTGGNACLRVKHGKSSNYLFLDGHIERLEPAQTFPDGKETATDLWIVN